MRALCGAIITAGAVIGLGLTALGIGTRYANQRFLDGTKAEEPLLMHLYQMDKPLVFILGFLAVVTAIGLGIAFFGLAYHHQRRHHEHLREQERSAAQQRTSV